MEGPPGGIGKFFSSLEVFVWIETKFSCVVW